MQFMPTGGITTENVKEYLAFDKVIACGGSWIVKEELIDSDRFDTITQLAKQAMELVED